MSKKHSQAATIHKAAYITGTDPAVTYPTRMQVDVLWLDTSTTPDTLKKRNASNDGWDTLGYMLSPSAFALTLLDDADAAAARATLGAAPNVTPTRTITGDDTLTPATDGVIIVNGAADVTIDDVAPGAGERTSFRIHNIGTDGYAVIFEPAGGRTVNGEANYIFSSTGVIHIDWDGSDWVAG